MVARARLLAPLAAVVTGCATASPDCGYGFADGHAYCFYPARTFSFPRRAAAAGACPLGYDASRVRVPQGTVCLARPAREVPAEICADLPEGCDGPGDRARRTPTDERRDRLVAAHGWTYDRCADRSHAVRLEPLGARLDDGAVHAREADLRAAYSRQRLPTAWGWGIQQCCPSVRARETRLCLALRVQVDLRAPSALDAVLTAIASIPGAGDARPGILVDYTPPEP